MNLSLKKILKHSNVLFISELDNSFKKIENILNLFFKKIYYTNSLEKANFFYEDFFPNVIIENAKTAQINNAKKRFFISFSFPPLL